MTDTVVLPSDPRPGPARDPAAAAAANARPDLRRLASLVGQLGAVLYILKVFNVESLGFFYFFLYCCAGFVVHYFAPLRLKKLTMVAVALAAGLMVIAQPDPNVSKGLVHYAGAGLTLAVAGVMALAFFGCLKLPIPFSARAGLLLAMGAGLMYARGTMALLPDAYWRIIGSLFMFRMILFAYEVSAARKPEKLTDYLSYIFLPPNFYFLLFPVVDYATFKKSWYAEDIHRTAQRGISLIVRGAVHLCIYRLLYHRLVISPADVNSFGTLLRFILPSYLLYTRISGQFHIATGMLHLFGYRLPDTNRWYLAADSFTDFWRRINIYWKDFMIKVFYYPAYFRLRKINDRLALTVATAAVFTATTLLHGYQWFWLQGEFRVSSADLLFWGVLGVLVWLTVLREMSAKPSPGRSSLARRGVRIALVYLTISLLWSVWSSGSLSNWLDAVIYWS